MLTYTEVVNLVWASPDFNAIAMDVTFDRIGTLPFCAVPDDVEEHGRELFLRAAAGDFGPISEYVAPAPLPVSVPQSVTPAQGLMALFVLKAITEDDILAAIGTIEDATLRYQAQISYKKATAWERASVTMQTLAGLLALAEPDLDELFTKAATYTNL